MIKRNTDTTAADLWSKLSAPLDRAAIQWRMDGKPGERNGRFYARFVAYADVPAVVKRLDAVVAGEWDFTGERIGETTDKDGVRQIAMKGRLQILGVVREDVGMGADEKQAMTDAIKRAARLFGIGLHLWEMEANWVEVESDSKYGKPVEDPWAAYDRRYGDSGATAGDAQRVAPATPAPAANGNGNGAGSSHGHGEKRAPAKGAADEPPCPKCGGRMWDNRATKRNPRAPDFKCRDRSCDGAIWPPKEPKREPDAVAADGQPEYADEDDIPSDERA